MKYLITFAFLVLCLSAKTQQNASFLIGRWKVVEATLPKNASAQEKKAFNFLKPNLLKSLFRFDTGGKGKFKIPMDNVPIEKNSMPLEDISWNYSATKKYVTITEQSNFKSSLVQFYVKIQDGSTYFILDESPVILKVVKY
ncbi:hypothetical protein ABIE26_001609 [Pedobacter africanus]|uniref:Uncharacterized protein n=1 Tax=Pedobacter africanus TaxID=151894 RepID=A0ACC6KRR0_9SPHI|nr:hypothetical protein [Pedobacter africanus]MDR6781902.1 hypothetical protein [Pedobacter africanus]